MSAVKILYNYLYLLNIFNFAHTYIQQGFPQVCRHYIPHINRLSLLKTERATDANFPIITLDSRTEFF